MTSKKTDIHDTDPQLPVVKLSGFKAETPPEVIAKSFAGKLEGLMNEAYQQSQVEGDLQSKWADWCNHLGDLWREVKQHAKGD